MEEEFIMTEENIKKNLFEVLNNTRSLTISTVCEDGSPWGTPLGWWAFDGKNIVFDNHSGTVHANNLARNGRCFITIFNRDLGYSRGVYIDTFAKKLTGDDCEQAKKLIEDRGLQVTDDIFSAPIGEIDEAKSKMYERPDKTRFYCYLRAENKNRHCLTSDTFYRVSIKAVIENEKGEVLMAKEDGEWGPVGGGFDHADETVHECLAREMEEEANITNDFTEEFWKTKKHFVKHKDGDFWKIDMLYKVKIIGELKYSSGEDIDGVKFLPWSMWRKEGGELL